MDQKQNKPETPPKAVVSSPYFPKSENTEMHSPSKQLERQKKEKEKEDFYKVSKRRSMEVDKEEEEKEEENKKGDSSRKKVRFEDEMEQKIVTESEQYATSMEEEVETGQKKQSPKFEKDGIEIVKTKELQQQQQQSIPSPSFFSSATSPPDSAKKAKQSYIHNFLKPVSPQEREKEVIASMTMFPEPKELSEEQKYILDLVVKQKKVIIL